jgi:hypothetical protein
VLSAGAFRQSGVLLEDSNLVGVSGAVQVDAPGQNIRSTFVAAPFGYQSGTSMAAPHVAGLAALLLSANPNLSAAQLREAIVQSGNPPAAGSDSAGTINAARALDFALGARAAPVMQVASPASNASVAPLFARDTIALAPATPLLLLADTAGVPVPVTARFVSASTVAPVGWLSRGAEAIRQPASFVGPSAEEPLPHLASIRSASSDVQRALTTAALLAYHVETGNTAMHWVEDGDAPRAAPKNRRQQSETSAGQDAAERHAHRPRDASATKTAPR